MDNILELLREDARLSPDAIAEQLDIPSSEVTKAIADYERDGVIKGYQAVINEDIVDADIVKAVIEIKITPEREGGFDRISQRVARFPEVDSMFLMSGSYDVLVFIKGRTLREVASFVSEKLATIDGVLSTATHFMLKTYKDQGIIMRAEKDDERLKVSP